jgi:hypothetical protein
MGFRPHEPVEGGPAFLPTDLISFIRFSFIFSFELPFHG